MFHQLKQTGFLETILGLAEFFRELVRFKGSWTWIAWERGPSFGHLVLLGHDGSPAWRRQGFCLLEKLVAAFGRRALRDRPFGKRMPGCQEISCNEVVQFRVVATEVFGWCLTGWHDGVVVGDLGVVEVPLGVGKALGLETLDVLSIIGLAAKLVECFGNGFVHVLGQMLRIGSRIRRQFEFVVEVLRNPEGPFGGPRPHAVCALLQGCEVKIEWRLFLFGSTLLFYREVSLGREHVFDGFLFGSVHDPVCFVLWTLGVIFVARAFPTTDPAGISCGKRCVELPVRHRNMRQDLKFMVNNHGEGGGLDPAK